MCLLAFVSHVNGLSVIGNIAQIDFFFALAQVKNLIITNKTYNDTNLNRDIQVWWINHPGKTKKYIGNHVVESCSSSHRHSIKIEMIDVLKLNKNLSTDIKCKCSK